MELKMYNWQQLYKYTNISMFCQFVYYSISLNQDVYKYHDKLLYNFRAKIMQKNGETLENIMQ